MKMALAFQSVNGEIVAAKQVALPKRSDQPFSLPTNYSDPDTQIFKVTIFYDAFLKLRARLNFIGSISYRLRSI
jgi:hypothetical protein